MNLRLTHSNDVETARWSGVYDTHPHGLISGLEFAYCCHRGHETPAEAATHAAEKERGVLLRHVNQLPDDSWGSMVLAARAAS